ncbi:MAG TPA: response regulator [Anaerolineae bacterium]
MPTRVLIVDPDQAFAMLLKEGLEANRDFRAVDVTSSGAAIIALQSDPFDLVIVDLSIDDSRPMALLRSIRDLKPGLPIMIIPLDGDAVPQELAEFNIRGVLSKPFFLPDLPVRVAEALGRPAPAPPEPAPPKAKAKTPARSLPRLVLPKDDPRVVETLRTLAVELSAEAALLTAGNTLIAYAGPLDRFNAETLAQRVLDAHAASEQAAWAGTGYEHIRYGQSIANSGEHLLYSIDIAQGVVLTVAVRPDSSLRLIRAQTRKTADALLALGQ